MALRKVTNIHTIIHREFNIISMIIHCFKKRPTFDLLWSWHTRSHYDNFGSVTDKVRNPTMLGFPPHLSSAPALTCEIGNLEDSALVHCACNTSHSNMSRESKRLKKSSSWLNSGNALIQHLSEKQQFSCFPVLPDSTEAQVIWGGIVKRLSKLASQT